MVTTRSKGNHTTLTKKVKPVSVSPIKNPPSTHKTKTKKRKRNSEGVKSTSKRKKQKNGIVFKYKMKGTKKGVKKPKKVKKVKKTKRKTVKRKKPLKNRSFNELHNAELVNKRDANIPGFRGGAFHATLRHKTANGKVRSNVFFFAPHHHKSIKKGYRHAYGVVPPKSALRVANGKKHGFSANKTT